MKKECPVPVTVVLILLAAALCGFGLWHGEAAVVLEKAVRICMECIGLG